MILGGQKGCCWSVAVVEIVPRAVGEVQSWVMILFLIMNVMLWASMGLVFRSVVPTQVSSHLRSKEHCPT